MDRSLVIERCEADKHPQDAVLAQDGCPAQRGDWRRMDILRSGEVGLQVRKMEDWRRTDILRSGQISC